jgi:hypothetical protein
MMKALACLIWIGLGCIAGNVCAQDTTTRYLISIYDNNDFMNVLGPLTDHAYTNGSGGNISYVKPKGGGNLLDRWMPTTGAGSLQILDYGITQDMYTPTNLSSPFFQKNDYRYSGTLYATHALTSYDTAKRWSVKTTITIGAMGDWSLAQQIQSSVHQVMDYQTPKGWNNQYNNDVLLNMAMQAEKELWHAGKWLEGVGNAHVAAGSMLCSAGGEASLYVGKMAPYFNGTLGRLHDKGWQLYGKATLGADYVVYNAAYQGGLFSPLPIVPEMKIVDIAHIAFLQVADVREPRPAIKPIQNHASVGITLVQGRFSIAYTQIKISKVLKGMYADLYGNMTVSWWW